MKIREVLKNKSKLSLIIGLLITNNIQLSNHTYKLLLLLVSSDRQTDSSDRTWSLETVDDLHLSVVVAVGLELHVHVKADDHLVLVVLAVDSQAVHVLLVADGLVVHVTAEDLHLH